MENIFKIYNKCFLLLVFHLLAIFVLPVYIVDKAYASDISDISENFDVPNYAGYLIKLDTRPRLFSLEPQLSEILANPQLKTVVADAGIYQTDNLYLTKELYQLGLLEYVEPNYIVTLEEVEDISPSESQEWFMTAIEAEYGQNENITGKGVRVGVIDSGVFSEHEAFSETTILTGTNYCVSEEDEQRNDTSDEYGHGTYVSGLIAATTGEMRGIAPEVELVPLKCFNRVTGTIDNIAAAIHDGVDVYACQVLNLSFGIINESRVLKEAIKYASNAGVIMVSAVGNSGKTSNALSYPAAWSEVVGVGAIDQEEMKADFSNQNASVWICAPGVDLKSLSYNNPSEYIVSSGTSYATPIVTAAAALALSLNPDLKQADFMDLLRITAWDLGESGYDTAYGYGLLNIGRLLAAIRQDAPYQIFSVARRCAKVNDTFFMLLCSYDASGKAKNIYRVANIRSDEIYDRDVYMQLYQNVYTGVTWKLFVLQSERQTPLCKELQILT